MASHDPIERPAEPSFSAFRASGAQQRMYFLQQLEEGRPTYHMPVFYGLEGPVDEAALRTCAQGLVDRHEALRTRFVLRDGELWQHIDTEAALVWSSAAARGPQDVEEWMAAEHHRPFDLESGPLFRAALLHTPEGAVLALAMHHIVADGWSVGILARELLTAYARHGDGPGTPGRPLPPGPRRPRRPRRSCGPRTTSTPTSPTGRRNGCEEPPPGASSATGRSSWAASCPTRPCPATAGPPPARPAARRRCTPSRYRPRRSPGWSACAVTPAAPPTR